MSPHVIIYNNMHKVNGAYKYLFLHMKCCLLDFDEAVCEIWR